MDADVNASTSNMGKGYIIHPFFTCRQFGGACQNPRTDVYRISLGNMLFIQAGNIPAKHVRRYRNSSFLYAAKLAGWNAVHWKNQTEKQCVPGLPFS
jgi:hypothetical protein